MNKTYNDMIQSAIGAVYRTGIANKILQHMDRIRNVNDDGQARRWVMELLQNCSDTAYDGKPVNVRITLESDRLIFQHNGKPFRVKDILSIINQVSSKNPDENTVGRFGTGFMSTFRLSEKVTICSVLRDTVKDENGSETVLPYRSFEVTLDRHGHTKEEVNASIQASMKQLSDVDSNVLENDFDPNAFNTSFIYSLDNDDSRKCAATGINDLKNTVRYILLFAPSVGSVEIENKLSGESALFERAANSSISETLGCLEISESGRAGNYTHRLVFCNDGELSLAALCDENNKFIPLSEHTPRVFTILPLVGSEGFPFPVVVNSLSFRPNEPRNGITLVDNAQSVDAMVNKELMNRAVSMYDRFLADVIQHGFSGLENIVSIPEWYTDKEMSEEWVRNNIYKALLGKIYKCKMILTEEGFASLSDSRMYIADGITEAEKEAVKMLLSDFTGIIYPKGSEKWNEALRNYPISNEKVITAEKLCMNAPAYLRNYFKKSTDELVKWCSALCELSKNNDKVRDMIITSAAPVYPNQDESDLKSFSLKTYSVIYSDPDIPEVLKDVSFQLDRLVAQEYNTKLEIRQKLLNKGFAAENVPLPPHYETSRLIKYITDKTNSSLALRDYRSYGNAYESIRRTAWGLMISCMKDRPFFDCCKEILGDTLPDYIEIGEDYYSNTDMWKHSVRNMFAVVCKTVSTCVDISGMKSKYDFEDDDKVFEFLSCFISSAKNNGCLFDNNAITIFPDLKGKFRCISRYQVDVQYFTDCLKYPVLYEIVSAFYEIDSSFDICRYTVDRRIPRELTGLPAMTDTMVSEKINSALLKIFSLGPLSAATYLQQQACTKLLAWIRNTPDAAKNYFPNYSSEEDQMKLLTPQSAAEMQRQVDMFENMMKECNIDDVEMLKNIVVKIKQSEDATTYYSDYNGVYADGLGGLTIDQRDELLRKIGEAGESYVFNMLVSLAEKDGYIVSSRKENEASLTKLTIAGGTDSITVLRGDIGGYKQSGWDIKVTENINGTENVKYYEIKTHSVTSQVRDQLKITNDQMKLAMLYGNDYCIVKVNCNRKNFACSIDEVYDNIGQCIADGRFTIYDGYLFTVRNIA